MTFSLSVQANDVGDDIPLDYQPKVRFKDWNSFEESIKEAKKISNIRGNSEILTGLLALASGLVGDAAAKDPMEKAVYSLFQTIGIASIGIGMYDQSVGDENQHFYLVLRRNKEILDDDQKTRLVNEFRNINGYYRKREDKIKMYTFGLMSLVQLYNASRVSNGSVKNSLMFLGSINALVTINFAF